MIVTVTPNPSVDRTLEVGRVERGEVLRATSERIDAGGKGVNLTRALVANGRRSLAVLPLGGADGHLLARLLLDGGTPHRMVPVASATRSNVTLSEPDGTVTKVNAPGQPLTPSELDAVLDVAVGAAALQGAAWVVGCGSLPDGTPPAFYATLIERARAVGALVAIDTSGPALEAALAARPEVIKPNLAELSELVGRSLTAVEEVVKAAEEIRAAGPRVVLVSLGAHGAVLVGGGDPLLAVPPTVLARSDVGAGDTLLAGFLAGGGSGVAALRTGVAWAAAAVSLPGTSVPGPDAIDLGAITVRPARDLDLLTQPAA